MEATLDKFGRIVIPKQVRDDLGLFPGSVLRIEERNEEIVLKPVAETSPLVLKDGVLVFTGEVEGDFEALLRRNRDERSRKLAGSE
ncbi:MAG TPA: AbrB/MazE/SpoVT family DNA-binding domain-containing protein [Thermoanaerobaculia bacterium]|jgi:AbrB family looped-hinge helix DNA binding protein